jgi:TetR/AcrR family transcriptional regulator, cholesterol catabolism regulator
LDLFTRNGYAETSVADVVAFAGLTKGAFYHYFPSKADLLRVCTSRALDLTIPPALEIAALDISATDAITRIFREIVRNVEVFRREVNLFLDEWDRGQSPELLPAQRRRDEYEEIIEKIVERGISAGEFRPLASPRIIAFSIFGLATHPRVWWRPNEPLSADELGDCFASIFLDGLRVDRKILAATQE